MRRRTRRRPERRRVERGPSRVGEVLEAEIGPVAHGGHCVARVETAAGQPPRVVFVRHALPGERVRVRVTEGGDRDRFWRADAVEVLEASPDRVAPPCPVAGPGLCGGCDFQHVALPAQRSLKEAVLREQLVRLGGLDPQDPLVTGVRVEHVPNPLHPGDDGLRWRTRTRFVTAPDGTRGLRRHRSHEVVPVEDCLITLESAQTRDADGDTVVAAAGRERRFSRAADGFWQVHPAAPRVLVEAVLDLLDARPGESVLDLFAGVGLFARFLADEVGPGGRVLAVEGDAEAAGHATRTLQGVPGASVTAGNVAEVLAAEPAAYDLVVLDPPRTGARAEVVGQVAAGSPRAVAYVACDPAALARDVRTFAGHGYRLRALRAFDLFPMTHHMECVALLTR